MGYSTNFRGSFSISPKITPEHRDYIRKFGETRRVKRNAEMTAERPDPIREAANILTVGEEGEFFVGETGFAGQDEGPDVVNGNSPPANQPGLWCQWTIDDDGDLAWDQGEKFYYYVEWLNYLIDSFFKPWGYSLNGEVRWKDDYDDRGTIIVTNNEVIADTEPHEPREEEDEDSDT